MASNSLRKYNFETEKQNNFTEKDKEYFCFYLNYDIIVSQNVKPKKKFQSFILFLFWYLAYLLKIKCVVQESTRQFVVGNIIDFLAVGVSFHFIQIRQPSLNSTLPFTGLHGQIIFQFIYPIMTCFFLSKLMEHIAWSLQRTDSNLNH